MYADCRLVLEYYYSDYMNKEQLLEFTVAYRLLEKYHGVVKTLVKIILRDLEEYRGGTHSYKDRIIARLKKFLEILTYYEESILCYTSLVDKNLYKVYLDVVKEIEEYIKVLESTKEMIHRERNKVFELVYPHLREALEKLVDVKIVLDRRHERKYSLYAVYSEYYIHYGIEYTELDVTLTKAEFEEILAKLLNRLEQQLHKLSNINYWRQYLECLEKENTFCWDPQDEILDQLEQFLKVISNG